MENKLQKISPHSSSLTVLANSSPVCSRLAAKQHVLSCPEINALTRHEIRQSLSFGQIRRQHGADFCNSVAVLIFNELLRFVSHGLRVEDLHEYARRATTQWYFWKPEDFTRCLSRGLEGHYGKDSKIFGAFSYSTFTLWAQHYEDERIREVEEFEWHRHTETKQVLLPTEFLSRLLHNLAPKEAKQKPVKPRTPSLYDELMRRFDRLFMQFPASSSPRTIRRYGKILDIEKFIDYKINQMQTIKNQIKRYNVSR